MSDTNLMRCALSKMLDQFKDGKPEHVLFTSFNFSASFFENNVLPLLCGNAIDEIKGAPLTRDTLNEHLAGIKTVVVCDRSAHPEPKGNLRYGLLTVGLTRGRFHPKLILMAGTLADNRRGLWLSVASGNLTFSGWGQNREVVGTTPVTQGHAVELSALVGWLLNQANERIALATGGDKYASTHKEEGEIREVLKELLFSMQQHGLPDDPNASLPTLHLGLPPAVAPGHAALLHTLLGAQQWHTATVVSPFWGGVSKLMAEIKARRYRFVPAIKSVDGYDFPDVAEADASLIGYGRFAHDADRYTHAKALQLSLPGQHVLCIGSANFTSAALLHGNGYLSNIEAMLRYRLEGDEPWSRMLVDLDRENCPASVDVDEGAPPLPPFEADVVYDWRSKQFHCRVKLESDAGLSSLILEVGAHQYELNVASAAEQCHAISVVLRQPVRSYKLAYVRDREPMTYVGLVTQLNAAPDELGYSPRPRLDLMLAFLHGLVPGKSNGRHAGGKGGGGSDGSDPDGEDNVEPDFDFFSFFLAVDKLRRYHSDARHCSEHPFGEGPTGIQALYRAVILQPQVSAAAKIGRYVQLAELYDTAALFSVRASEGQHAANMQAQIEEELKLLEREIEPLLQASPQWTAMFSPQLPASRTFLTWFRQELIFKQSTPR